MGLELTDNFFDRLLAANQPALAALKKWLFHPGMLFRSGQQWWGQKKPRSTPHEGLDLCWFEDVAGNRQFLDQTTVIPAPFSGKVMRIFPDFLGQSIFLAHAMEGLAGKRLFTAFGHTTPLSWLGVGDEVLAGDILATVSAPGNRKTRVPPHLHITLGLMPGDLSPDRLMWETLGAEAEIILLDPLTVFPTCWAML